MSAAPVASVNRPSPPPGPAWPGFLLRGALLALAAELVAAAVARVVLGAVPGVVTAEPLARALTRGGRVAGAAAALMILLDGLLKLLAAALRRGAPPPAGDAAERAEVAWLLLLALGTPWALTRWSFGVTHGGLPVDLPVLARTVSAFLPWLVAALAAEVLLRGFRLVRNPSATWCLLRALLGLGWGLLLLALVTGPDLLRGDPLEWGTRLRDAGLSQEWLNRAPLAPTRWWPALQLGAMVGLLITLLAAAREAWQAWRAWRTDGWRGGPAAAPQGRAATGARETRTSSRP